MAQAINRRPFTSETRVWSWASPCEVYCGQISNGTDFSPTTPVSSCHFYSTNAPSSSYYGKHWTYEYFATNFFSLWRVKPWNILWKLVSAVRSSQVEWHYHVGCVQLFNQFAAVRSGSNESLPVFCPIVFSRLVKNLTPKQMNTSE
jgi:hypothetical protein